MSWPLSSSLCLPITREIAAFSATCSHHDALSASPRAQKQWGNSSWSETSENVSPNQPSHLTIYFSQNLRQTQKGNAYIRPPKESKHLSSFSLSLCLSIFPCVSLCLSLPYSPVSLSPFINMYMYVSQFLPLFILQMFSGIISVFPKDQTQRSNIYETEPIICHST